MTQKASRLIATDLDGTLFNEDAQVSARTVDALEQAHHAGYETVVVTGRSWRTAVDRLKPCKYVEYIICANGACLFQRSANAVTWENTISLPDLATLLPRLRSLFPSACFGWESADGWGFEPAYLDLVGARNNDEIGAIAEPLGEQALYKLFIRSPDLSVEGMLEALPPNFSQLAAISASGAPFLEATAATADKGSTLAYVARQLAIPPEKSITFGDNLNDYSMIKWAGTGVAMGNAVAAITKIADATTLSNIDDGVAHYIEQLLQR